MRCIIASARWPASWQEGGMVSLGRSETMPSSPESGHRLHTGMGRTGRAGYIQEQSILFAFFIPDGGASEGFARLS